MTARRVALHFCQNELSSKTLQRSHSFRKLQNAEVRAVQTLTTLCKRCGNAVQSPRTQFGGVYFEHAQNKRRGLAFPQRVRQHAVGSSRAPWARCERAVCTL